MYLKLVIKSIIVFSVLSLSACAKKDTEKEEEMPETNHQIIEEKEPDVTEDSIPVTTKVECTGKVQLSPQNMFSIHSKVEGFIKSVKLIEGQPIRKGNLLTIIESPNFAVIQKEYLKASANYEYAKGNFDRKNDLYKTKSLSQKEMQKAEMELKTAKAEYLGLKAELNLMGFSTTEIEKEGIQKNLAIYSPANGYITNVNVNNGKKVSLEDLLFEIINYSNVHIQMQVNSKDARKLHEGDAFTAIIPGEKRKFTGKLHYINKRIESETNTVVMHGHLDKVTDANELLVGSMVFIKF